MFHRGLQACESFLLVLPGSVGLEAGWGTPPHSKPGIHGTQKKPLGKLVPARSGPGRAGWMGFLRSSHAKKRPGKRPGPNAIPFQQSAQGSPSDGHGKSGIEGQVGEGGKVSGAGVFRRKEAGKGEG